MRYLILAAALALASPVAAQVVKPVLAADLPNAPGKTMTVITVTYAPGEKSGSHRHADSAFIYARVLSGHIRSEVAGQGPVKDYGPGEGWTEGANAHHLVSENASATEPASLLVVIVANAGAPLTTMDPK